STELFVARGVLCFVFFFFSSRRRHTRCYRDWSSDVCSSDLARCLVPSLSAAQRWNKTARAMGVLNRVVAGRDRPDGGDIGVLEKDRKSVGEGKRVGRRGRRNVKTKKLEKSNTNA